MAESGQEGKDGKALPLVEAAGASGRTWDFGSYEKRDHCAYVTLDRPQALNALGREHHGELAEIWSDFASDDDSWVAILSGSGERAFCAGYDLKSGAANPGRYFFELDGPAGFGGLVGRNDIYKPIIAAVNGHAIGGGLALVLACDLVVAVEGAEFAMPEPRLAFPSAFGGLERLIQQIPTKFAMEVLLLAKRMSAAEALRMGIINRVVKPAELSGVAVGWATEICASAPRAVRANMAAARRARELPLEVAVRQIYRETSALWESNDFKSGEGAKAFVEKREPRWQGN